MKQDATLRVSEGKLLWEPADYLGGDPNIISYLRWLNSNRGLEFSGYEDLWSWSTSDLDGFWSSILEFFQVKYHGSYERVISGTEMPGVEWFKGAYLNYSENALSRRDDHPALVSWSESRPQSTLSYLELYRQTAACAAGLRKLGVVRGDRVVAVMPNISETVVAFLATASIGAIWSSCSPEFGISSMVDRFRQIEPCVLIVVDGYRYRGKPYDMTDTVSKLQLSLPTLKTTVIVPLIDTHLNQGSVCEAYTWKDLFDQQSELLFESVPFDHPLWVLYSSGTTGPPKAIVQGHGGILLEHLKTQSLHLDLNSDDRFFWFTSTGWMMWNFLVSGLSLGVTVFLYDGHPTYPDAGSLWRFAEETGVTYFGTSASYIHACMRDDVVTNRDLGLGGLRGIGSTGSPLSPEGFEWVYSNINSNLILNSFSGGTDLCTGFLGASPLLPVRAGEIPCRLLGAAVASFDGMGRSVVGEVGELVITSPMPSMPLFLWDDPDGLRYRESYFEMFPGVWRHGDWIKITDRGSCVLSGRSDSTLNRGGVRMGTSEFYRVVDQMFEVKDSLIIDTGELGSEGKLMLMVVLADEVELDGDLVSKINSLLRQELSPRHVPDEIYSIPEVPYTLNGKKMEIPVKRILWGIPAEKAVSRDAMSNPETLDHLVDLFKTLKSDQV